jgi:chaperone protein EcpD
MFFMRALFTGLAVACLFTQVANANVVVTGTRVILTAHDGETTVSLHSHNSVPVLIESWVDSGDEKATPETTKAPFLVTPPMLRMEANNDQALRVLFTGDASSLPADRESLFFFNVLEIPPKPDAAAKGNNYLQLAMRTRLKLFYRPAGLAGDEMTAINMLTFKANSESGKVVVVVHNPSAYYVTIGNMTLQNGSTTHKVDIGMVAPFSDIRLSVAGLSQLPVAGSVVNYGCVNDYGGVTDGKKGLL